MSIVNLYSKQQKVLSDQTPTIYRHDDLPAALRVQIVHIWDDAIGHHYAACEQTFADVHRILSREYGSFGLVSSEQEPRQDVVDFFLSHRDAGRCLDVIQLIFGLIDQRVRKLPDAFATTISPDEAIEELNGRFKEHGIGFQFCQGNILRIDSEFTHQEITVPALKLLQTPYLTGANQEFLAAHEHYRHGRYKECLNDCLKAFESTMKAICHERKWPYNQTDTARPLIKICEDNGLLPVFMQNHLTGLRTTLESGVPTARNKTSGHGQGVTPSIVSEQFASYVLNLTATNIRFLAESEHALK
jgi:hypothetical protein